MIRKRTTPVAYFIVMAILAAFFVSLTVSDAFARKRRPRMVFGVAIPEGAKKCSFIGIALRFS